jgi:hypothetical protein
VTLRAALEPMLRADPARWRGLPPTTVAALDALLGAPEESLHGVLGYYPANRRRYRDAATGEGLVAWARDGAVVMVETLAPPDVAVLAALPQPAAVLEHEILVPSAYAHEYLYPETGLVLTVAEPLRGGGPKWIVRCRGVAALASPEAFGPAYYRAFDDQVRWSPPDEGGA